MPYKDILVHVDHTDACAPRLQAAVSLAFTHQARLTGVFVNPPPLLPTFVTSDVASYVIEFDRRFLEGARAKTESTFFDLADKAGVIAEFRAVDGFPEEGLGLHARHGDIMVVGQYDPDHPNPLGLAHLPEDLALGSGRPVLIVPYAGAAGALGSRVLVAWNGSREAARAVGDALPILEKAEKVWAIAVSPDAARAGERVPSSLDIASHLARHGVRVEARQDHAGDVQRGIEVYIDAANDISIGDMLLSRAADLGADMIVMGAYGHSQFREWALGGVTRHILTQMTVPVLMSH